MPRRSFFFLIAMSALLALGFTSARASRHHHSVNISGGPRQPATACSDLRIRFDDQDAVVRSEERTLTKAEAAVLQVEPHTNGGVQVVGWDNANYSVTACKAAAASGDAERILSEITMSIEGGRVSTKGPGDDEEWTVYLLIRTPKSATLDLETMNGPLSFYDVEGKLTARAHNGPISLKNFSGDAEITAVNGPISLDRSRGSVRIHTENGPISVELEGTTWSGTGLTADAKNGPVTLMVPSGYQSSFVVESTNYAPVSCKASICENARKTWDDEHRRIEFGNSPAMIRLSTVNGPVSVREPREKL
ncbi:MAG TPA: hypothetical protein VMR90_06475 [Candidatus Cybelea sp.]|nr:hypothetical protein [Candidatus Cybelea sp.]